MFLLNIQSVRNKKDELTVLLEFYNKPNFVLLTEHWLNENEPCYIPDYNIASIYCRKQTLHGGSMILVHKQICDKFLIVNIDKFDDLTVEKEFEFSIILVKCFNLYVVCIYRPPSCDINVFINRLEMLLFRLPVRSNIILAGDFNINFIDVGSLATQSLNNLLNSLNLKMHVCNPTRITQFSATMIDYFCSNLENDNILDCRTIPSGLSDHEAVLLTCSTHSGGKCKKIVA